MKLVSATPVLVILVLAAFTSITTAGTSTTSTTSTATTAPELVIKNAIMILYPASTLVAFVGTYLNLPNNTRSWSYPMPAIATMGPSGICTSDVSLQFSNVTVRYFYLWNFSFGQGLQNNTSVAFYGYYSWNGTDTTLQTNATIHVYHIETSKITIYPNCVVSLQPPIIQTQTQTVTATQTTTQTKTVTSTQTQTTTTTQTLTTTSIETTTATSTETTTETQTQILTTTQISMVAVPYIPFWLIVLLAVLIGTSAFFAFTSIHERHKERFYNVKNEDR